MHVFVNFGKINVFGLDVLKLVCVKSEGNQERVSAVSMALAFSLDKIWCIILST